MDKNVPALKKASQLVPILDITYPYTFLQWQQKYNRPGNGETFYNRKWAVIIWEIRIIGREKIFTANTVPGL